MEDEMDLDSGSSPTLSVSPLGDGGSLTTLVCDQPRWLPRFEALHEDDLLVLLTPVVLPISHDPADTKDPFESFGRSIASRHDKVRHVPYTQRNQITSTHLGFIKRATVIVLCLAHRHDHPLQLELADVVLAVSDHKPCIVVVCSSQSTLATIPLPTVIRTIDYSTRSLEATAALIFNEGTDNTATKTNLYHKQPSNLRQDTGPRPWQVTEWNPERDISGVWDLWTLNISGIRGSFSLDTKTLGDLLDRPGYSKHYVVYDPQGEGLVGFCATYLSYVDQAGEKLIASLAILLVRSSHHNQGVGLSLHRHALDQLRNTRGVMRVQLGSTFPRILYGPPLGMNTNESWFRRRGWQMDKYRPGQGRIVYDMLWVMPESPSIAFDATSWPMLQFRGCTENDIAKVLNMVEHALVRDAKLGWYDQYSALMTDLGIKDVILGIDGDEVVAAALTYTPDCGSMVSKNLPWAGRIGSDVGGITCICSPESGQDGYTNITLGLLDACVKRLVFQGMRKVFIDGVSSGIHELKRLGFTEWAQYKDVWTDS
ncbi:acetyltransferase [Phlyctema vagabunda]|uniref:Acetyltransferase n=1 Tax=Phlyctema vagabunda TaxID=108571 RepID=A0ABR4PUK9_9HELO